MIFQHAKMCAARARLWCDLFCMKIELICRFKNLAILFNRFMKSFNQSLLMTVSDIRSDVDILPICSHFILENDRDSDIPRPLIVMLFLREGKTGALFRGVDTHWPLLGKLFPIEYQRCCRTLRDLTHDTLLLITFTRNWIFLWEKCFLKLCRLHSPLFVLSLDYQSTQLIQLARSEWRINDPHWVLRTGNIKTDSRGFSTRFKIRFNALALTS